MSRSWPPWAAVVWPTPMGTHWVPAAALQLTAPKKQKRKRGLRHQQTKKIWCQFCADVAGTLPRFANVLASHVAMVKGGH